MKILIFNWRDIKNPSSGGAEIMTHEMAKRWVLRGNSVTLFSSFFKDGKKEEIVDGVKIIRRGSERIFSGTIPVHLQAFLWYLKEGRGNFDVVIDEIHGIPFFTPLYVKEKKVALICEVAGDIWDTLFPFPLNEIGKFVEKNYFKFYTSIPFLTISHSTELDLIKQKIKSSLITVLPMGISVPSNAKLFPKEKEPTILFVGRLSKTKGVKDAIAAFEFVNRKMPSSKLWIVGRGDETYEGELKAMVEKEKLTDKVIFYGYVDQKKKYELMSKAYILIVPSQKEGWGLIVPEAGFFKTPAVVYEVGGLKDIVRSGKNGIVVAGKKELGDAIIKVLQDKRLYLRIQKGAYSFARAQDWEKTAQTALSLLGK